MLLLNGNTEPVTTVDDAATVVLPCARGNRFLVTLGGDRVIELDGDRNGQKVEVLVRQDVSGGRAVTWPDGVRWQNDTPPTLSTDPFMIDVVVLARLGEGNYLGFAAVGFPATADDLASSSATPDESSSSSSAAPPDAPPDTPPDLLTGLWGAWRFDGDGTDSSGNGRTVSAAIPDQSYGAGLLGNALLTGSLLRTDVATTFPAGGVGTFAFWVRTQAAPPSSATLGRFGATAAVHPQLVGDGVSSTVVCNFGASGLSAAVPDDAWVHVALAFDVNLPVYDLYVNGVLADTASNNDNLVDPAGTRVFVAATNSGISTPIDMALAYTVRLDAAQVAALYNAGIGYDPTA